MHAIIYAKLLVPSRSKSYRRDWRSE